MEIVIKSNVFEQMLTGKKNEETRLKTRKMNGNSFRWHSHMERDLLE